MNLVQIINLVTEWSKCPDIDESELDVEISPDCKEFKIVAGGQDGNRFKEK